MNRQSIFSLSVAALALGLLPTNVVAKKPGTTPPPSNVVIPQGYSMTAVATGLNSPTAMTFFGDTAAGTLGPYSRRPSFLMVPWTLR